METSEATAGETGPREAGGLGLDQRPLADQIKEQPLLALGVAALAGFVAGGGAWTRAGVAGMMLAARIFARRMAVAAIAKAVQNYGSAGRSGAY
ncbi:MAG TPA: hypothetical protein VJ718_09870 [Candidatus Binataceae bacterium]|jgi:hypothetical protein|nr:hypothetical protein [Candidatus Binataceae bacterium]